MPYKHKYEPHLQLKEIRKQLHKTQKQLAEMLGVSYPYLLSVETGQRDMSEPLARKITLLFGVTEIRKKKARPTTWDQAAKKLVPFSQRTFDQRKSKLPTFTPDPSDPDDRITPRLKGYSKAFHALLDSAPSTGGLGAVLQNFFNLFAQHVSSDVAIDAFQASYRKLYPHDSGDARRALVGYVHDRWERERSFSEQNRVPRQRKRKRR
jgi:transcriptional regulator with XRE-family HTH domain